MKESTAVVNREKTSKRVSYALFFASCGMFLSLQLICFICKLSGIDGVVCHDIIFLVSAVLSFLGCVVAIVGEFSDISIKRLREEAKGKYEIIFLIFALLWTFIATVFATKQDVVWLGNSYNKEGFVSILGYGAIAISAYRIKDEDRKKLIKLFILASLIPATFLLFVNIFSIKTPVSPTRSVYRNSNHYGYSLCVLSILSAGLLIYEKKLWQKVLYGCGFLILNANLLVSDCFGAHLGQIAGLICLVILKTVENRKIIPSVIILVALMALGTTLLEVTKITSISDDYSALFSDVREIAGGGASGSEGSSRLGLWGETLTVISKVPFFGKGLDCYYGNNLFADVDMPHNEYLQIASNVGIPVLICYLAFLTVTYVKAIQKRKALTDTQKLALIGGVGYLVSATFGNTFLYTYPILVIMLAFGMVRRNKCSE